MLHGAAVRLLSSLFKDFSLSNVCCIPQTNFSILPPGTIIIYRPVLHHCRKKVFLGSFSSLVMRINDIPVNDL